MQAWFFLIGPLILGGYGFLLLFNVFGATKDMSNFYKRRGDWYPILPGDDNATHRLVGGILLVFAIITTIAMMGMHVL
ncbi:MAG TPA: hypothetical protein VG329_00570 [Candidatus Dormibacteraeota bacterium]|jgi:hypothetical protein|nr:hypothetical protein [Candidatus Dormibacteraeota bacterium]